MLDLVRREFLVEAPLQEAWQHLARIEDWPGWAGHIRRVELRPAGEIGPDSTGTIYLRNGPKSTFHVTEFNPGTNWRWNGRFLWLDIEYDHQFRQQDDSTTLLTWVVRARGFGVSVLGRLFAFVYERNLDRAIPTLCAQVAEAARANKN